MAKKTVAPAPQPTAFDLGMPAAAPIPQRGTEAPKPAPEAAQPAVSKTSFTMETELLDDLKTKLFHDKVKFQAFLRGVAKLYVEGKITPEEIKETVKR